MTDSTKLDNGFRRIEPQEEARPYDWETELTGEQRSAARQVLGLLQGLVEQDATGMEAHEVGALAGIFPPILEKKRNNVILIAGSRGSGKTSLLVTILFWLRSALQNPGKNFPFPVLRGVLPVAVLDLHPLSESTHLLLYLVGRLEQVVRALEDPVAPRWRGIDEPPWKGSGSPPLKSRGRWAELFQAVASWEGNLEQRAPNLDPDSYAWELGRTEKYRREISVSFRQFIDALCTDIKAAPEMGKLFAPQEPFFLITLDDADLVPGRTTEVLDLLRKLWHPRLAFLLTGDSDQFLAVLRNDFLGKLLRPLTGADLPDDKWEIQDEMARAVRLANSMLEKVIPPTHRCRINNLSREDKLERLEFSLQQFTIDSEASVQPSKPRGNLFLYFKAETFAAAALPDQLRSLLSLCEELNSLACEKKSEELFHHRQASRAVQNLWRHLLEREPLLSTERDLLQRVVALDEREMLTVDRSVVRCLYTARAVWTGDSGGDWRAEVLSHHRLIVSTKLWGSLPEPLTGLLVLATDLVGDIRDFHFPYGSPVPDGYNFAPVIVYWEEFDERLPPNGFAWPLPDWQTFLDFTTFSRDWDQIIGVRLSDSKQQLDISMIARYFIEIVLAMANGAEPQSPPREWDALAKEAVELAFRRRTRLSDRDRRNSDWALSRAGLLGMPESGLPARSATAWLEALRNEASGPDTSWPRMERALIAQRREQVKSRWEGTGGEPPNRSAADAVLAEIDRASKGFPLLGRRHKEKSLVRDKDIAPEPTA